MSADLDLYEVLIQDTVGFISILDKCQCGEKAINFEVIAKQKTTSDYFNPAKTERQNCILKCTCGKLYRSYYD